MRPHRNTSFVFAILAILLVVAPRVFANTIVVNTNNDEVDSTWSAVPFQTDPVGDSFATADRDIVTVWLDADDQEEPTVYYFRIERALAPKTNMGGTAHIHFDCDMNNNFFDGDDEQVNYWVGYDEDEVPESQPNAVWVQDGNSYSDQSAEDVGKDYEIQVPAADLGECAIPPFNVYFSVNFGADTTESKTFGGPPTSIVLNNVEASSLNSHVAWLGLIILLGLMSSTLVRNQRDSG